MPQRFLRPGITTSSSWNRVSFPAQSLFVRLITLVDDFGRYDGRVSVIHGAAFSVWNEENPCDEVTTQKTASLCAELAERGLVDFYETDGKKVAQLAQWQERARSECSKYPDKLPPSAAECCQSDSKPLRNPASIVPRPSSSPTPSPLHPRTSSVAPRSAEPTWTPEDGWSGITDEMRAEWGEAYPACELKTQLAQMSAWLRANPSKAKKTAWQRFITNWLKRSQEKGGDIPSNRTNGKSDPRTAVDRDHARTGLPPQNIPTKLL